MYICPHCHEEKEDSVFQQYKGHPNGWCRQCRTTHQRESNRKKGRKEKRVSYITDGKKLCLNCEEMKFLSDFSPSSKGIGRVSSYCRVCWKARYYSREKAKKYTKNYRVKHREIYLAKHRIHQYNRKSKVRAVSDGTVTEDIMIQLYSTEKCYYCNCVIEREKRTMEHILPLNRGGIHSSANIVMACFTCNSSKRDMTEEEFNDYRCKNNLR